MADDRRPTEGAGEAPEELKIMCYVSKEMVPLSQTVEVEYAANKKFRVLPKYVKFEQASEQ
jgi:hypothetical protein